ncbi:DUF2240 family protein [Candidatus Pacearchaeota archaeon]|nr:DUF2240 family protein [Candidatus Pacearchaeota archaeon]
MNGNYEKLLSIISKSSGLSKGEIELKVNTKREKISGMISHEGAAQIIAAELGIAFENEKLKISDLLPGMRKVNIVGKILSVSPIRTFTTKNGQEGKVVNLVVADETGNIKVVLWDLHHIELIEKNQIANQSIVEISNGTMREEELHLGSFSEFKPSNDLINDVKTERVVKEKKISELKTGDNAAIRGFIVQTFEPRSFNVCPQCKKKVNPDGEGFVCLEHGKILEEKRFLMNFVLDDGSETTRAVAFHETLLGLGFKEMGQEAIGKHRENLLGKEMSFSGVVRLNKFFNNQEFIVSNAKEVNPDELIISLEKN